MFLQQNGGYIDPPRISRQHRDPYGDWWDKQERRNYGEPVHEDNDVLGLFAPEDYNFYTSPQCFALIGCAVATFLSVFGVVYIFYPDMPAVKRGFEDGLDRELGGKGALLVSASQLIEGRKAHRGYRHGQRMGSTEALRNGDAIAGLELVRIFVFTIIGEFIVN